MQDPIIAIQAILVLHPLQAIEQARVMVAHAFGPARGAGGVDAVGQALRRILDGGRVLGLVVGLRPVAVQAPHRRVARRQALEQRLLGEQQRHVAVLEHEGQAIGRVVRIERQIGAARLDDRQQSDGQFCRALGEHPDPHITTHPLAAQPVGQAVGPCLKLGISELALAVDQRTGVGSFFGLVTNQLRQHRHLAVVALGGVPALQQLLALLEGEQRQALHRLFWRLGDRLQQAQEVPAKACHRGTLEQVAGIAEATEQLTVGALAGVQHQVELGAASGAGQRLDRQPRQCQAGQAVDPIVIEQHLEQRVVTEAALRLQGLDQLFERQVLVGLGVQHVVAGLAQQPAERGLAVDLQAQYLGVDEEAHQALGFLLLTAANRHADPQVALTAVAHQQHTESCQQQHEQRTALLQRQALQLLRQCRRHGEFAAVAAKALLRRTWVVQGQFKQRMLAAQVPRPVRQLSRALAAVQPLPLPHGEVGVLDGQPWQLWDRAGALGAVTAGKFFQQQFHRGTVGNDVVQGQQQHVFLCRQAHQAHPHQRASGQVEGVARLLGHALGQLAFALIGRQVLQADFAERQWQVINDPLAHPLAIVLEHRAQRRMARLQLLECHLQRGHPQRAA